MLPLPLLALSLFSLHLTAAQQGQTVLSLNAIVPITLQSTSSSPMRLALPSTTQQDILTISIALCSNSQPIPNFFLSNDSLTPGGGGGGTRQLSFEEGIATWKGGTSAGERLDIYLGDGASSIPGGEWSFEVAVSSGAPLHRAIDDPPLLGDTTATQALLFSPPFAPPSHTHPSYPNYTLPAANLSAPDPPPPSAQPNFTLILAPTDQLLQRLPSNLFKSACAIHSAANGINGAWVAANGTGGVNSSTSLVLRDVGGWRSQWVVEGLTASTNYTAWVLQGGGAVAGPIFAFTMSSSFPCHLVHSLPFCPLTSYAVPLPPPPGGATSYTVSNLPSNITNILLSSLSNFTISLLTFPCGRDIYSPLQSCENCADAYRAWACAVSFPRCGEIPASLSSALAAQPTTTGSNKLLPTPALLPHPPATVRNSAIFDIGNSTPYNELLPCVETCQRVDRACPPFLLWSCPRARVNANWSYGIGFIDGWDGEQGEGNPGVAQDRWGVNWCNG